VPAEIWIDGQDRLRKESLTFTAKTGTTGTPTRESFEFSAFGTPVHVTAPPARDVVDFSQLFGSLGSNPGRSTSVPTTTPGV